MNWTSFIVGVVTLALFACLGVLLYLVVSRLVTAFSKASMRTVIGISVSLLILGLLVGNIIVPQGPGSMGFAYIYALVVMPFSLLLIIIKAIGNSAAKNKNKQGN